MTSTKAPFRFCSSAVCICRKAIHGSDGISSFTAATYKEVSYHLELRKNLMSQGQSAERFTEDLIHFRIYCLLTNPVEVKNSKRPELLACVRQPESRLKISESGVLCDCVCFRCVNINPPKNYVIDLIPQQLLRELVAKSRKLGFDS
jgi:hypothetical protein